MRLSTFRGSTLSFTALKTLHTYLTRQVIASLLMTLLVFTFVLLLGNGLKEILPLMVSGQVSFGLMAKAVGLLIPWVWVFALPMGMLTAALLIFGRFSADQELTAVRASGISLLALIGPILLLSLALCGVSALVNMELGPRCRVAYTTLLFKLRAELSTKYLPEGRFIRDYPGYIFYIGKNRHEGELQDIMILKLSNETNVVETLRAPRGTMQLDSANRRLNLALYDCKTITMTGAPSMGYSEELTIPLDLEKQNEKPERKIGDMSFAQLLDERNDLDRRLNLPLASQTLTPEQLTARQLEHVRLRREILTPIIFNLHRQVATSFACFGFTLLGIPLGIRVHRRETNIGIAIALLLVAVYYSFILVGQALNTKPECFPHLIVWAPNFLFQGVGAFLLYRANRGT